MSDTIYKAYHFPAADMRLGYSDGREIKVGETLTVDCKPKLCKQGLHASVHPMDALGYASSSIICGVEVWGDVVVGNDRIAGRNRHVVWIADISKELRLFAVWCARQVKHLMADERSIHALEVAERHANGAASDSELDAARDAVMDATWSPARDATWAWAATWRAAWAAARRAAWAAARAAAWPAQCAEFQRVIDEVEKKAMGGGE